MPKEGRKDRGKEGKREGRRERGREEPKPLSKIKHSQMSTVLGLALSCILAIIIIAILDLQQEKGISHHKDIN